MLDFYKNQYSKSLCCEINILKNNKNKCQDNSVALVVNKNGVWKLINNYILKDGREKNKGKVKIKKKLKRRIVIVLESPHKKEYDIDNIIGYPALGSTGVNINRGIEEIINEKLSNIMDGNVYYELIFMNAIQYQASLGVDTNVFRDRMWINLWLKKKMRDKFIERIQGYEPDIIVNLCTKGNHSKDLLAIINGVETTIIGNRFIESLNIDSLIMKDNKIILKDKIVCEIERDKNNLSQGYTLRGFVNNAIEEAFNNKVTLLKGPHPSCWKFDENNRLNQTILNNINF